MSHASPQMALLAAIALMSAVSSRADDANPTPASVFREGFEAEKTSWKKEETDATVEIQAHERSVRASREGQTSERFAFVAGAGSVLYYSHVLPKIPVNDEVRASLQVRSNHPGVQFLMRVVLPSDVDPDTNQPSFLLLAGPSATTADRWQKLEMSGLATALERQARVLRVGTSRKVSLEGAYLDRVVVNLYGGPGENEVFVDDLEVGPIAAADPAKVVRIPRPNAAGEFPSLPENNPAEKPKEKAGAARVQLSDNNLTKDGFDWVPTIIDAPGADPVILRQHGFDVFMVDRETSPDVVQRAINCGLLLGVRLRTGPGIEPEATVAGASSYPFRQHVAFWDLGERLGESPSIGARKEELERIRSIVAGLHDLPPKVSKITFGTLLGMERQYALAGRNLDVLGFEATDWAGIRDPIDTIEFLLQRKRLCAPKNPRVPIVAWIDACARPEIARNVWGTDPPPSWGGPQVQPEQIRMYSFAAISAGCRALAFRGDAELTTPRGKARLMEMALINAEIDLVESVIARGPDTLKFWPCFDQDPEVPLVYSANGVNGQTMANSRQNTKKLQGEVAENAFIRAASIPTGDGFSRLMFVTHVMPGAQYQPPQMAANSLRLRVQCPDSSQGFEITPAGVEVLKRERRTGGVDFILPVFSGTALVLVTTDLTMKQRLEAEVARIAAISVEFAIRLAESDLAEVTELNAVLSRDGHPARDADDLLRMANELVKAANDARERMDYGLAWSEAKRAGRALRVLKRKHYDLANMAMSTMLRDWNRRQPTPRPGPWTFPVSLPPLTSFETLPQAYLWLDWVREGPFSRNLLPSGSFDLKKGRNLADEGWTDVSYATEGVATRAEIVSRYGYGPDNAALRLFVGPKDASSQKAVDALVPFLDHPAVALKSPPIPMKKGNIFRIRALVVMPRRLIAGTGGLSITDSIGGPSQEIRNTLGTGWREILLYRRAPEDGQFTVTLGFAGFGEVFFDDLRVESIVQGGSGDEPPPVEDQGELARRPALPSRDPQPPRRR